MLAALTSALPDRVPIEQRAEVGGFIGISQMLGTVLGAADRHRADHQAWPAGTWRARVVVVVGALAFMRVHAGRACCPCRSGRAVACGRSAARCGSRRARHPDFGWGWATHFLVNLGNALGTLYLLYFLADAVHYRGPADGLLILMALYGVALIIGAVVCGIDVGQVGAAQAVRGRRRRS